MSDPDTVPPSEGGFDLELRTFGRRRGRTPSAQQRRLLETVLPRLRVDLTTPYDRVALCGPAVREVWLEIGFGGGEHLVWQAQNHPDVALIGCEPYEEGVTKVLAACEASGATNIRVHADDARPLLRWLPPGSIDRAFVLFPDPWPKKRHVKRRLVNVQVLKDLARVMPSGAELRLATDIADYARTMLLAVAAEGSFEWRAERPSDWRERPTDWPQTRYESKAVREGRRSSYLIFRRR